MTTTNKIHYRNDFDFLLTVTDAAGNPTQLPDGDFTLSISTGCTAVVYKATRRGDTYTNCHLDEQGRLHVVCNDHRLPPGKVRMRLDMELPDGLFPDNSRRLIIPGDCNIELTTGASDIPTDAQVEVIAPYIKGDKGDKGDSDLDTLNAIAREVMDIHKNFDLKPFYPLTVEFKKVWVDGNGDLNVTLSRPLAETEYLTILRKGQYSSHYQPLKWHVCLDAEMEERAQNISNRTTWRINKADLNFAVSVGKTYDEEPYVRIKTSAKHFRRWKLKSEDEGRTLGVLFGIAVYVVDDQRIRHRRSNVHYCRFNATAVLDEADLHTFLEA